MREGEKWVKGRQGRREKVGGENRERGKGEREGDVG